jgi:hypothetical protein
LSTGVVHAALGRYEEAIACAERAFEDRDCWVVALAVEPAWTPLRGNPRFEALLARVGVGHRAEPTTSAERSRIPA